MASYKLASGKLVLQNKPKTIAYQRRDVRPVAVTSKVRRSTEKKLSSYTDFKILWYQVKLLEFNSSLKITFNRQRIGENYLKTFETPSNDNSVVFEKILRCNALMTWATFIGYLFVDVKFLKTSPLSAPMTRLWIVTNESVKSYIDKTLIKHPN